ncbi:MAG: hypothetical protein WDM91_10890 [Rhizomicrobium sp.]
MGLKISSLEHVVDDEGEWEDIKVWGLDPSTQKYPRVKVRSLLSKDYQTAREMLIQKETSNLGRAPTSPELEPALGELVATHLLRGWEGFDGDDGKSLAWSMKTGIDYLTNAAYRAVESQVILAASRVGDRDAKFTEAAAKNSEAPSATI